MADKDGDAELEALAVIVAALNPLDNEARTRVLDYLFKRLGLPSQVGSATLRVGQPPSTVEPGAGYAPSSGTKDIRTLKTEKQPKSANQMAALVAYYLSEHAPKGEHKETVTTADIEKYFKQAPFPLPQRAAMTLPNATAAGYFDQVAPGQYRLNPVGYNLVVHSLPADSSGGKSKPRAKKKTKRVPGKPRKAAKVRKRASTKPASKTRK